MIFMYTTQLNIYVLVADLQYGSATVQGRHSCMAVCTNMYALIYAY